MTEVEKFCNWVEDQVANHGLLQISGVHLDKGGTAMDVLKSKANSAYFDQIVVEGNKEFELPSLEAIAKEMNYLNDMIAQGNYEEMKFEDSSRLKPYVDDVERFDASELFDAADKLSK